MTLPTENEIEELLAQFEQNWQAEQAGPSSVRIFVEHACPTAAQSRAFVTGLAGIDIEMAWQHWDRMLGQLSTLNVDIVWEQFQRLPRLEGYCELLGSPDSHDPHWRALVECEAAARSHWGDNPGAGFYRHRWGVDISDRLLREPARVQAIATNRLSDHRGAVSHNKPVLNALLRGHMTIGRQRTTDKSDWSVLESFDQTRVVITHRMDTNISRNQLLVQVLNPKSVWLKNGSSQISNLSASGEALAPGQSQLIELPFIVNICGVKLLFESSPHADH